MKVAVAIYEHRHGTDVRVFTTMEQAWAWRQEIAAAWWEKEMQSPMPADPEEAADEYFDRMGGVEFLNVEEHDVEGG